ncbi:Tricalbin-2 [Naganishia albida]|nr:Tricalbin-2 [Naganishia albida]
MAPSDHAHLPGFHLGKPILPKMHSKSSTNATNPDVDTAPAAFSHPESAETKSMEQQLVNSAMGADVARAPVHTFDPDASPLQKASATATGGRLLGSVGHLGTSGLGAVGKIGSTGFGVVQKVGSTGVGAVSTIGSAGAGMVTTVGSAGLHGAQAVGAVGLGGLDAGLHGVKSVVGASGHAENDGAHSLAVDLSTMDEDVPDEVIGLEEEETASHKAAETKTEEKGDELPGEAAVKKVVGWLQSVGGATGGDTIAELKALGQHTQAKNIFTVILPPSFFGTAYHNAAIVLFAVLATRVLTMLHFGWGWLVILLAFCMSTYSISMDRTRARARDDIARELMKTRLVSETETADWINSLLDRAWLIAEPLLSATVVAMVDDILQNSPLPPGLDSIRMTTFTLGNKAPKIDSVRTYPMTPDDEVIMEWALSFTPNDLEDLTPKEARNKVNPKIALSIRVGKGVVGAGLPILLEDISFVGKLRIKLKLMSNFPHVQTVSISFMEKPDFDYVLKPLTPFDVNSIPGLSSFIKDQVHANLGPMLYDPNVFTINLEQLLSGRPLDSAIGVLKVTIDSARGLKATKIGGGDPDPYVSLSLGTKDNVGKTSIKRNTKHPRWQEQRWILLNTVTDSLNMSIFDYNEHRTDSLLGTIKCDLSTLLEDSELQNQVGKIVHEGKDRGEIQYSLAFYPVVAPKQLPDGTVQEPEEDVKEGIARVTIHQAKDLVLRGISGTATTHATLSLRGKVILKTPVIKHNNTPTYEMSTEFLVADKNACQIGVAVINDKPQAVTLGTRRIKLTDLLAARDTQQDWFDLEPGGKVRLTVDWKPVEIPGGLLGTAAWSPPVGIMRILVKKAKGVKNVEFGGKSDPYCRVISHNTVTGRTEMIKGDLNPVWNSYIYAPVRSVRDQLILEVMDYQKTTKDRSLGTVALNVADYAAQTDKIFTSKGTFDKEEPIRLRSREESAKEKGTLYFEANFVPCIPLKGNDQFPQIANASQVLTEGAAVNFIEGSYTHMRKSSLRSTRSISSRAMQSVESIVPNVPPPIPEKEVLDLAQDKEGEQSVVPEPNGGSNGIALPDEKLIQQEHGVLVLRMYACELAHKGRLEVLLDENYWPVYSTDRTHSRHLAEWNQTAECVIRELPFSQITFRMNDADETEKDEVDSSVLFQTKDLIEMCLDRPRIIEMRSRSGAESSKILVACKYIPLDMVLDLRESVNNMGNLRVELIDGHDIRSADRNGKSDPYVVFSMKGERVHKSEVQKKTLTPKWNESFNATVESRVDDHLELEVFDWNQFENAKLLGQGFVDLSKLEPFQSTEYEVPLTTIKHGTQGSIRLRIVFSPTMVMHTRRNSTTMMQTGGRVVSTVGAVPLGVGKGVGKGVFYGGKGLIHGVGHTVGFAGRKTGLIKKRDKHGREILVSDSEGEQYGASHAEESDLEKSFSRDDSMAAQRNFDAGQAMQTPAFVVNPSTSEHDSSAPENHAETINITCVKASLTGAGNHETKPYAQLTLGRKSYKTGHAKRPDAEWSETFKFGLEENDYRLSVKVFDHKTLGKDREIGHASLDISRYLQAGRSTEEIHLDNGQGQVVLVFEPVMASQLDGRRTPSIASKSGQPIAPSPSSRFSFKHRN